MLRLRLLGLKRSEDVLDIENDLEMSSQQQFSSKVSFEVSITSAPTNPTNLTQPKPNPTQTQPNPNPTQTQPQPTEEVDMSKLDVDGDGQISKEELEQALVDLAR